MDGSDKVVFIYTTWPTSELAERAGRLLVERGLAACVNIFPPMTSIYVWEGATHRDHEVVMIAKTRSACAEQVEAAVKGCHPYDNPAIAVLAVEGGSEAFLDWVLSPTRAAALQTKPA